MEDHEKACIINDIIYNTTFEHKIEYFTFGNIKEETMVEIYRDGRAFSHFIEPWLAVNYPLIHVKGCKGHDHISAKNEDMKFEQKTFTARGCKFMPSNMIGEGRKFDKEIFEEKAKKLVYIIVSNIEFPRIRVRFVRGIDLLISYPLGVIPVKDFIKFFN